MQGWGSGCGSNKVSRQGSPLLRWYQSSFLLGKMPVPSWIYPSSFAKSLLRLKNGKKFLHIPHKTVSVVSSQIQSEFAAFPFFDQKGIFYHIFISALVCCFGTFCRVTRWQEPSSPDLAMARGSCCWRQPGATGWIRRCVEDHGRMDGAMTWNLQDPHLHNAMAKPIPW